MPYNVTLSIPKIHCGGCVATIKNKTKEHPGVISVEADEVSKTATYVLESATYLQPLKQRLAEIGFPAAA
jgi:copper chaperone CopZ